MAGRKPTLGYPSRTDAVLALQGDGLCDREIARRIGIEISTVAALAHSAGRRRRRPSEEYGRTVVFPTDVLDALKPHAAGRGISANELARRIVCTAVDEEMIDAILDDRHSGTEP
jgi:hypothetical protein